MSNCLFCRSIQHTFRNCNHYMIDVVFENLKRKAIHLSHVENAETVFTRFFHDNIEYRYLLLFAIRSGICISQRKQDIIRHLYRLYQNSNPETTDPNPDTDEIILSYATPPTTPEQTTLPFGNPVQRRRRNLPLSTQLFIAEGHQSRNLFVNMQQVYTRTSQPAPPQPTYPEVSFLPQENYPICTELECPICYSIIPEIQYTKTNCNHIFCSDCFKQLYISPQTVHFGVIKCPMCRTDVSKIDVCDPSYSISTILE
jgi:hypothetical protein